MLRRPTYANIESGSHLSRYVLLADSCFIMRQHAMLTHSAPHVLLQDEVEIFFSAHGVPVSYVEEAGDPYKEEMEQCISLIMQELQRRSISNHHTLAYQSRVGPVEWLQPYTDVTIRYVASATGTCIGLSDCSHDNMEQGGVGGGGGGRGLIVDFWTLFR